MILPAAAQAGGLPEIARGTGTGAIDIVGLNAPAGSNIFTGSAGLSPGFGAGYYGDYSTFGPYGTWGSPYDIYGSQVYSPYFYP